VNDMAIFQVTFKDKSGKRGVHMLATENAERAEEEVRTMLAAQKIDAVEIKVTAPKKHA